MGYPTCNVTLSEAVVVEEVFSPGWTVHKVLLWIAFGATILAVVLSLIQIMMHATHYLMPWEQKHIIRILFIVPAYSVSNFLIARYYTHSIYFLLVGNAYGAFGLAAFFNLLSAYMAPDLHQQEIYFRTLTPQKWRSSWCFPIRRLQKCTGGAEKGWLRTPRSGLTWFNMLWSGVIQYCFVLLVTTLAGVIAQAFGRYCSTSINPAFANIWVVVLSAASAYVSSNCLDQFSYEVRDDVRPKNPKFQLRCIKVVLFLSTYQTLLISILLNIGAVKPSRRWQITDEKVTLPATLLCVEIAVIAVFHIWAYPVTGYRFGPKEQMTECVVGEGTLLGRYKGGWCGMRALVDAFNWWDLLKAMGRSSRWVYQGRKSRHTDLSYNLTRLGSDSPRSDSINTPYSFENGMQKSASIPPVSVDEAEGGPTEGSCTNLSDISPHMRWNQQDSDPNDRFLQPTDIAWPAPMETTVTIHHLTLQITKSSRLHDFHCMGPPGSNRRFRSAGITHLLKIRACIAPSLGVDNLGAWKTEAGIVHSCISVAPTL